MISFLSLFIDFSGRKHKCVTNLAMINDEDDYYTMSSDDISNYHVTHQKNLKPDLDQESIQARRLINYINK